MYKKIINFYFATEYLKADYIFWCTEEPYFSSEAVPFLKGLRRS